MRKGRFIRLILAWGLFFVFTDLSFALDYFELNNKTNRIPHVYFQNFLPASPEKVKKAVKKEIEKYKKIHVYSQNYLSVPPVSVSPEKVEKAVEKEIEKYKKISEGLKKLKKVILEKVKWIIEKVVEYFKNAGKKKSHFLDPLSNPYLISMK